MSRTSSLLSIVVMALALFHGAGGAAAQVALASQPVLGLESNLAQGNVLPPGGKSATAAAAFGRFFLDDPTSSTTWWKSHTAVDASDGVHVTFHDQSNIYYAHCAANCGDPANWLTVPVADAGLLSSLDMPTVGLDPNGRPRLMWYGKYEGDFDYYYYYAECNSGCTASANNWTSVVAASLDSYGYPRNTGYFALNGLGQPRLVYPLSDYPDSGFYYVACDSGCTTASNWHSTSVITPDLQPDALQLVFGPDDRPRVVGYDDDRESLVYAQCDSGCSQAGNWNSVSLFDVRFYVSDYGFSLAVDEQGRPRIAYYQNNVLHYAWSNASPLTPAGWDGYTLPYPGNTSNWTLDLALDSQGRPQVAFGTEDFELSHLACTANCESASPTWQQQYIDTGDDLDASSPIGITPGCLSSVWMVEGHPSLALDSAGRLSVSYYVKHAQLCPDWQGRPQILYDAKGLRFAHGSGSGTPGQFDHGIYLPLTIR